MTKLKVLDLFSGIGGFSLGLERAKCEDGPYVGFETVAFCEIEEFPRKVLARHWPSVPCYRDVRELTAERLAADGIRWPNVITGGYPCQPFSLAGKRDGQSDDRHLWPEIARLIDELGPDWFVGENVYGHISLGLDEVLADLESKGYSARAFVIPACAVGAIHRRDRVWIVAHASGIGGNGPGNKLGQSGEGGQGRQINAANSLDISSNAMRQRQSGSGWPIECSSSEARGNWEVDRIINALRWPTKPAVRGRNDGVPRRLDKDRLKALGNAVVPQIPELIGNAILQALKESKNDCTHG